MNKGELIDAIAKGAEITRAQAEKALSSTVGAITDALKAGDSVALIGFGTFKVSERAARTGKNPKTGASLQIAARKVARFAPGASLKTAVAGPKPVAKAAAAKKATKAAPAKKAAPAAKAAPAKKAPAKKK